MLYNSYIYALVYSGRTSQVPKLKAYFSAFSSYDCNFDMISRDGRIEIIDDFVLWAFTQNLYNTAPTHECRR